MIFIHKVAKMPNMFIAIVSSIKPVDFSFTDFVPIPCLTIYFLEVILYKIEV